jgi:hypothetical protein
MEHGGIRQVRDDMGAQVYLGGTVGVNDWRDRVTASLAAQGVDVGLFFNPVVGDWNQEAQTREDRVKATAPHLVYVIGNPGTPGNEVSAYSLVELVLALVDDRDQGTRRTVAVFDTTGMSDHVTRAITKTVRDLKQRFPDAAILDSIDELIDWLAARLARDRRD